MPLWDSPSQEAVGYNLRELAKANETKPEGKKRPHNQMVAIALAEQDRAKKDKK